MGNRHSSNPKIKRLMDSGNIAELMILIDEGFECKQCGDCCRIGGGIVRVSQDEIADIAEILEMPEYEFIDEHCELSPDRRGLIIKDGDDGACSMLSKEGRCIIYPARPKQCRTFPYEWVNKDSFDECPGLHALIE